MIDFHSHILPKMDDGSHNADESKQMLEMLFQQGIDTVVATPHFHANVESVSEFLKRREAAYEVLMRESNEELPKILLGAEVRYYQGISRMEELKHLSIGNSKLLLLEMPMSKWSEYNIKELEELSCVRDITLVLAHIDRYLNLQKSSVWQRLYESGILMQVNADFFTGFFNKRKALDMLCEGKIHFIGSDCHNLTSRPPNMDKAIKIIKNKLSDDFLNQMNQYGAEKLFR